MSRPTTLPEPWLALATAIEAEWLAAHPGKDSPGAVSLTAGALVCVPSTVFRWSRGDTTPSPRDAAWIRGTFRKYGIKPPL